MKPFFTTKKKMIELLVMLGLGIVLFILYPSFEAFTLFCLGFIWNWVGSQSLESLLENKRYRFSMVKMIVNLQTLVLSPFQRAPEWIKRLIKVLPAGLFWCLVILFNESEMPWWSTFLGSLAFELLQLEIMTFKKHKEESL